MIRREIQLPDRLPQWLLTTQVEHARVSAWLAKRCLRHFGRSAETGGSAMQVVRNELFAAILHHDDGWANCDANPEIDAETCRPASFRELPLDVSLPIWSKSIETAECIGALAAWVVAGHFLALLSAVDKPIASLTTAWQHDLAAQREKWFADWQAIDRSLHSRALADDALRWLQLFDVMSLWLCSVCPGRGEHISHTPKSYCACLGQSLETEFGYERGHARIQPWRFDVPSIELKAVGWVVPIREYGSRDELFAARVSHSVQWDLAENSFGLG